MGTTRWDIARDEALADLHDEAVWARAQGPMYLSLRRRGVLGNAQPAKLSFMGHLLTENRHGQVVDIELTPADGSAERRAALTMLRRRSRRRVPVGADKGYDSADFVAELRAEGITRHEAQHTRGRRSAIDGARRATAGTRTASVAGRWSKRSSAG